MKRKKVLEKEQKKDYKKIAELLQNRYDIY